MATTSVQQAGAEGVSFTPDAGQTITCTFVNDADESQLMVTKHVANVAADYAWSAQITVTPDPSGASPVTVSGTGPADDTATFTDLVLNQQYTINEIDPGDGWSASELECTYLGSVHADEDPNVDGYQITITEPGSAITCELTNTANSGQIELTKSVAGLSPAADWSFDFELATGDPVMSTDSVTVSKAQPATVLTDLLPGETYHLNEVVPAGWSSDIACTVTSADGTTTMSSGPWTIQPGDSITCEAVNTADPGELTISKSVVDVADDLDWSFEFELAAGDPVMSTDSVTLDKAQPAQTVTDLLPGETYTLAEVVPAGWSSDIACTVTSADGTTTMSSGPWTIQPGDSIDCDVINTAKSGELMVAKQIDARSDQSWEFSFTIDPVPAGADATQTITGVGPSTETIQWTGLTPGVSYRVTEADPGPRWVSTDQGCMVIPARGGASSLIAHAGDGVNVAPGDHIACGFANTARGDLSIDKSIGEIIRLGGSRIKVSYTIVVTSDSAFVEPYHIDDVLRFGQGITVLSTSVTSGDAGINPAWNGMTSTELTNGQQNLAPSGRHTYTVSVEASVSATSRDESRDCVLAVGETGTGLANSAQLTYDNGVDEDDACGAAPSSARRLPRTGSEAAPLMGIGFAAIIAGGFLLLISRRRRRESDC